MKRYLIMLIAITLALCSHLSAQWQQVAINTDKTLLHIDFLDSTFGWIFAEDRNAGNSLFLTFDGGETWLEQPLSHEMYNCEFASTTDVFGGFINGEIYYSDDMGANWALQQTNYVGLFDQLFFVSPQVGWAAGSAIYSTQDGGATWQEQDFVPYGHTWEISFVNETCGSRVGFTWPDSKKAYVSVTQDAGETWDYHEFPDWKEFRSVEYLDTEHIFVAGSTFTDDVIGYSEDGGNTWTLRSEPGGNLMAACFPTADLGWKLSRYGIIKHTINAGQTWQQQLDLLGNTDQPYFDMYFESEHKGWVCGANGELYRYFDGTGTHSTPPAAQLALSNYPNPFNPSTTICLELPVAQKASIFIYDATGRKVRTLMSDQMVKPKQEMIWDGTDDNHTVLPSGIYFAQAKTATASQFHKLILMK
ncbi:MAG: T9SS type A sorting domain-containing protein [Candidatus Cloacimonetes bacterium]|nr:T9SS type A sorting domain-containing protein [Candidatus Cloacimonadota bacterium]